MTNNKALSVLFPLIGLGTLVWFLIRVIPKPSRAGYPCMRAAAPIASSFVVWLMGIFTASVFLKKAGAHFRAARYPLATACIVAGGIVGALMISANQRAGATQQSSASRAPNSPIGVAKGIHPGRVVWVHDSSATRWQGPGYGHWWQGANTDQKRVDSMLATTLASLTGKKTVNTSWDTLFRFYNVSHGRGNFGYRAGEKIVIKANFSSTNRIPGWCAVDTNTYSFVKSADFVNTSPQMVRALLRQLVNVMGVSQADIAVGDPVCYYPSEYFDSCHTEFPNVKYLDY